MRKKYTIQKRAQLALFSKNFMAVSIFDLLDPFVSF